jgi:hypothetical protein
VTTTENPVGNGAPPVVAPTPVPAPAQSQQDVIIRERHPQRFEAIRRKHAARAHVALVVVTSRGATHVYGPEDQPTAGELLWKRISSMYEVDMGQHQAQFEDELPSSVEAVSFRAVIDLQWQVIKPYEVVRRHIGTLERLIEALRPELMSRLRPISRQHSFADAATAEREMNRALSGNPMGIELGLAVRPFVQLKLEVGAQGVERDVEMEKLKQRLRMIEEENRQQLVDRRMVFYRRVIEAGDPEKFVLLMSENPSELPQIMQAIRNDRDLSRQQAIEFFQKLADSGLIERHEMSDVVRETLVFLQEGIGRVLPNSDPLSLTARRRRQPPGEDTQAITDEYSR